MKKEKKSHIIIEELREHIPFTLTASLIGVVLVYLIYTLYPSFHSSFAGLFEILHPAHIFVASIVSAGIYYRYKRNFFGALLIGVIGSILIGSLSDVIFPWLGGVVFGLKTSFHLPVLEEPLLIFGVALIASLIGIATRLTKLPHFLHVFLSVFASLFYLLAFSISTNLVAMILVAVVVFVAVIVPCCFHDIVFPLLFVGRRCEEC